MKVRDKIDNFVIRHLPNEKLKIRIGVHSGPIVGGVVGKKMLRWCLFGETRHLADKLESTGKSKFIHISERTKNYLMEDPDMDWSKAVAERDEKVPELKNYDCCQRTYWLLEDGRMRSSQTDTSLWYAIKAKSRFADE